MLPSVLSGICQLAHLICMKKILLFFLNRRLIEKQSLERLDNLPKITKCSSVVGAEFKAMHSASQVRVIYDIVESLPLGVHALHPHSFGDK